ncbi:60S ribosomal protein L35 [Cadophora sp. M221]|nr:60S ribosomal protein L35 [Cadophora sp. M221]
MSSGKVKTGALWSKNKTDLAKQLGELKTELGQLRTQKIAGGSASKLTKIDINQEEDDEGGRSYNSQKKNEVELKSIAKVLTVINANQRSQLRLFYKNKKYLPLDLRPKQTRAIRRRLTKHESGKTLEKTKKKAVHFPQRKYAIKAEA